MSGIIRNGQATGYVRCLFCNAHAALRIENQSGATADFCKTHADLTPLIEAYEGQTNGVSVIVVKVNDPAGSGT
jgi:hypothetical protein